ncbi:MAG TPA: tripartite tricarboxylate transporter substrate-binding protein [Alphaproteobacteria bacterium]|jgi:tripartite-type tricarboxylate transporter receptor subunit TctC
MQSTPALRLGFVRTAVLAGLFACAATGASAQQDPSIEKFYKGQNLRLILSAGEGGGYGTYAFAIKPYFEKYLPGHPTIIIQHMQGAGGVVAANWLGNVAAKDGSVMALLHRGAVSITPLFGAQGIKYDPSKFGWIGSMNSEISVCASWFTSPIKTFEDLKKQPLIVGGLGPGSDTDIMPNMINNLFGTQMKLVTGYNSGGAIQLAVERGELQGRCGWSVSSIIATKPDWITEKKLNFLVQIGVDKHESLPDVPLLSELASDQETKDILEVIVSPQLMGRPFLTPQDIPPARLAALRKAFDDAMADPGFIADANKAKLEYSHVSGQRIEDVVKHLYSLPRPIIDKASAAIERTDHMQVTKKAPDTKTVKAALTDVKDGGKEIVFKAGDATQTATLSGGRSKVTFGGKDGDRAALKAGQTCSITYAGDKTEASLIACE